MERFGRYLLADRIAQGGMAEVYRGALLGPQGFSRPLAIKRIRADAAADPDYVRMLLDEARITASLQHPNIVTVSDLGEHEGQFFLVMEYVEGRHLGQVISTVLRQGGQVPRALALLVLREALMGLHHAHTRTDGQGQPLGIVHRDISPQNIMVGFDGSVRVADFGIATALKRSTQTGAGVIKGKCAYLSPEQASAEPLDGRCDLYALGVVAWEALAGRRMFPPSMDELAVMKAILSNDLPRLSQVVPDLPASVVALVEKALQPQREDRYPSAEAFAQAAGDELVRLAPGYNALTASMFMKQVFPAEAEEERRKVSELSALTRKSTASLLAAVDVPVPPQVPAPTADADTVRLQGPAQAPPHPTDVSADATTANVRAARRRSSRWPAAAAAALLLTGAGAFWLASGSSPSPAAEAPAPAARPTVVQVETIPAGALVHLGNEPAARGRAPLRLELPSGAAVLRASHPGRKDVTRVVTVAGPRMDVLLELPREE